MNSFSLKEGKVFIIAEAGVNHNGDLQLAKKLVDVALDCGVDAVKFQTFLTEELIVQDTPKAEYQKLSGEKDESQFDMIKKLELSHAQFSEIKKYCDKVGILFLSTPDEEKSCDFLDSLDVPLFKIGSGEITNLLFIDYVARKKRPIILSSGMSSLDEIAAAIETIYSTGNPNVFLLHCVSDYPTRIEDINLKMMQTLASKFSVPIGLSDHTEGIDIPIAAAAMGAVILEKHFTLDKKMDGPDHSLSLDPAELRSMVRSIRNIELARGDGIKRLTEGEKSNRTVVQKILVAARDIDEGETISNELIRAKRAGAGITANQFKSVIGKIANKKIKKDQSISSSDLN